MCFGMVLTKTQKGEYDIIDYDPSWPQRYVAEAAQLRAVFGNDAEIEHIGPTAVPGYPARPVIEILVVAQPDGDGRDQRLKLARAGYIDKGDALDNGTRFFSKMGTVTLYLCPPGHPYALERRTELETLAGG